MEDNVIEIRPSGMKTLSKRCKRCGIQPKPADMVMLWGYKWEESDICLGCKRDRGILAEVVVIPKLQNIPTDKIEDWYVPLTIRQFARRTYIASDNYTKIYISDGGRRFWMWAGWPANKLNPVDWDVFIKAFPNWKAIEPSNNEGKVKSFSHIAY